jgi:hypothetical protein
MDDVSEPVVVAPIDARLTTTNRPVQTILIGVATMLAVMVVVEVEEDGMILMPQKHLQEIRGRPAVVVMVGMILTRLRVVVVVVLVLLGVPNNHENLLLEREIEDPIHHEEVEDETVEDPGQEEDPRIFVDRVGRNRIDPPPMGVDEVVTSGVPRLRRADHQGMVVAVTVG